MSQNDTAPDEITTFGESAQHRNFEVGAAELGNTVNKAIAVALGLPESNTGIDSPERSYQWTLVVGYKSPDHRHPDGHVCNTPEIETVSSMNPAKTESLLKDGLESVATGERAYIDDEGNYVVPETPVEHESLSTLLTDLLNAFGVKVEAQVFGPFPVPADYGDQEG